MSSRHVLLISVTTGLLVCKHLRRTQAGPVRAGKQQQEQISPNHVQAIFSTSVFPNDFRVLTAGMELLLLPTLDSLFDASPLPPAPDEAVQLLGVVAGGDGHPDGGLRHARRHLLQRRRALAVGRSHLQGKPWGEMEGAMPMVLEFWRTSVLLKAP